MKVVVDKKTKTKLSDGFLTLCFVVSFIVNHIMILFKYRFCKFPSFGRAVDDKKFCTVSVRGKKPYTVRRYFEKHKKYCIH